MEGWLRAVPALAAATCSAPRLSTFLKTEGTPSQYRRGADSDTPSVRSLQQLLSDRTEGVSLIVKSDGVVLASPFISLKVVTLNDQLTDGGPSVTPELPSGIAGPPFGAALG